MIFSQASCWHSSVGCWRLPHHGAWLWRSAKIILLSYLGRQQSSLQMRRCAAKKEARAAAQRRQGPGERGEVVEDRDVRRTQSELVRDRRRIDRPVRVGHRDATVLDPAGRRDRGALDAQSAAVFGQLVPAGPGQVRPACPFEPRGLVQQETVARQCEAGIGAADVADQHDVVAACPIRHGCGS